MKIATWNVNSLNVRLPQVLDWLQQNPVDVLAVQETKMTDEKFPAADFQAIGYHAAFHGQKTYNGVTLISRTPAEHVTKAIPGFEDEQARVIAGSFNGVRVIDCYVVNGQEVDSNKYHYKLRWLKALRGYVEESLREHEHVVVTGDFNIAPNVDDTWDADLWEGKILCSDKERAALNALIDLGLTDCWQKFDHGEAVEDNKARFTWWDYRQAGFRRNLGLRIDHVLATATLAETCTACAVDLIPRSNERPSDHAPVVATFAHP